MKTSRARVTKVPPVPPEPYYKVEANLDHEDAKHLANWLRYNRDRCGWTERRRFSVGHRDLLEALEDQGL